MYEYIRGNLEMLGDDYIVIDVQGIGYKIFTSQNSIKNLEINTDTRAFTHLVVKEDDLLLYGFSSKEELKIFKQLISVSGVGPKAAVSLLSQFKAHEIASAIITKNIAQITKAQGIGKKIAERIILELKDKIDTDEAIAVNENFDTPNDDMSQVIEALMALGYNYSVAAGAVARIKDANKPLDIMIKDALKLLASM